MDFREFSAEPIAAPNVEAFWMLSTSGDAAPPGAGLITPDGCVELVFALGDSSVGFPLHTNGASGLARLRAGAFVLGMTTRPLHAEYSDQVRLFGIRLRPAAAVRLFGPDLAAIRDTTSPLSDFTPDLTRNLSAGLESSRNARVPREAVRSLATAITNRRSRGDERVERAITVIMSAGGRVCLSSLSREVGLSMRHLDRCFDRLLGMCPKLLCRIARFQSAWSKGLASRHEGWAMIADRCGYADQAHLCREFREFSGLTPGGTNALG